MKRVLVITLIVAALLGLMLAPASPVMAASATRTLPLSGIAAAGENFVVDISVSGFGAFGQVVETLPPGFSYVSCDDLSEAAVDVAGLEVKFTLLAEDTDFSYTVKASSTAGTYTFNGILKDEDKVEYALGGDSQTIVPATRSLPSSVTRSANFNVGISTFDFGAFGQVIETLPPGFSYVSCDDLSEAAVDVAGLEVKFTLLAEDTDFSYTVKASSTTGTYTFSGILKDEDKTEYDVGGQAQITVAARAPTGGGVGVRRYYVDTNLFGIEESFRISDEGEILSTIEATSEAGDLTIVIEEGTIALDEDGDPLEDLEIVVDPSPPDPPEGAHIIGLAYNFSPDGATFDPPITMTYTLDLDDLPDGVAPEDLVIAYWDGDEWVELDSEVVIENSTITITAEVEHFTTFAIIGAVTPPEEEEVVPPEEEEVVPPEEEEVVPPEEEEVVPPEEVEIVPAKPPVNWPLIGGIIGGVIVVALLIFFMVRRRRVA